jgi:uncharacterized protein YkwD
MRCTIFHVASAALLAAACTRPPAMPAGPAGSMAHLGPERLQTTYDDARADVKRLLLDEINRERAEVGAPALRYDARAARVGDAFCIASAALGSWGHWDIEGQGPYRRWARAGGVDYHAENAGSFSATPGTTLKRSLGELLLEAHETMMAEQPPDDGHRRTVLDPDFTHLGIGAALVGGEFRMSEEFVRAAFEWVEVPSGPRPAGSVVTFRGRPRAGLEVGVVEVRHEPSPHALTLAEIRARGSYSYPPLRLSLWGPLPGGYSYSGGESAGFRPGPFGTVDVRFRLDAGPGDYYVLAYVRPAGSVHTEIRPATGALIVATP